MASYIAAHEVPTAAPRPVGLLHGAWLVATLAWRAELARRQWFMLALLALPVMLASWEQPSWPSWALAAGQHSPATAALHERYLVLLLHTIAVLFMLMRATATIGDEIEQRTLIWLLTRPLPRSALFLGKWLWTCVGGGCALSMAACATVAVLQLRYGGALDVGYLLALLMILLWAAVVYGSVFFALSLWLPAPTLIGLAYGIGVERLVAGLPGHAGWCSIRVHLLASFTACAPNGYPPQDTPAWFPLAALAPVTPAGGTAWVALGVLVMMSMMIAALAFQLRDLGARLGQRQV